MPTVSRTAVDQQTKRIPANKHHMPLSHRIQKWHWTKMKKLVITVFDYGLLHVAYKRSSRPAVKHIRNSVRVARMREQSYISSRRQNQQQQLPITHSVTHRRLTEHSARVFLQTHARTTTNIRTTFVRKHKVKAQLRCIINTLWTHKTNNDGGPVILHLSKT
jgi:hypothetical protein